MMISLETGQPSAYFPLRINKSQAQEPNSVVPIKFPSTRNVLWESKPVGDFETLALTLPKQAVQLFIVEKSLRLAHRYSEDRHLTSFLLGSVYPKTGEGGVCFGVDRFDPGREITEKIGENVTKSKVPTAVVPGDHIIPITVKKELLTSDESISHTKDEFSRAIQIMESNICGKDVLTLSHVVSLKANLYCCRRQDELIITLHCGAIVPDLKFQARPIAPLAIIPTTLARNLAGPLRLSDVEGTPKMGYVTMDQTRKLLLLLESDPKAYDLPLIGIWISGVHNVHHPYVWASCLRYLNCCEIKDRVLHSSGSFLLLHYSTVQKIPDFWECFLDNNEILDFELLSCQESLHLDVDDCRSKEPLCFHLVPSPTGMNKVLFDEAIAEWKNDRNTSGDIEQNVDDNYKDHSKSSGLKNDDNPRPTPSPHPSPTQVKTPNAPAPEESLSLSFDEASTNFDKNHPGRSRENTKKLAPRFKQTPNTKPTNRMPNKSDSFKISRQPFKQITPQDQGNSPSSFPGRGKSAVPSRNAASKKGENKENTPLTSRTVPQGNVHRKSTGGGTGKNFEPFFERGNKFPRSQSVGAHQEKTLLSDKDSSNPRMPVKVTQVTTRQRHHSEDVQSHQTRRSENVLHRTHVNSHSSLALSDDDNLGDISLDSPFTKNNEVKHLSNQSPSNPNRPTQPSPNHHNHSPKPLPSNCETSASKQGVYVDRSPYSNQPSNTDSCNLKHQRSPLGNGNTRNQSNADTRQNSPKVSCNVHSFGGGSGGNESYNVGSGDSDGRTFPSSQSDARRRSRSTSANIERQYVGGKNPQPTNRDTHQSTEISFDNDGRQFIGGRTAHPCNNDTDQRRISETDLRQSLPNLSNNGTPHLSHGNPHVKPSNVSGKSPSGTSSVGITGTTSSDKNSGNFIQQQSPNIYNTHHISASRATNSSSQQSTSHQPKTDARMTTSNFNDFGNGKVEAQGNACVIYEQEAKLSTNKELEDQVKRQEDMIRVLQEQVRSLLRVKEAISSESDSPSLPLTPAPTPVSNHLTSPKRSEEQNCIVSQAENVKQQPERVTIGVNTGTSLLWEVSRDSGSCEQCCEWKRPQSDLSEQDVPDSEPPEHPDVFLTPEKTESLIDPSQVDVEADSSQSLTPAISNMMIPSLSAEDESSLSNQAVSTSQAEESPSENEVPVKGREFYDKLLCQVKDLLSDQLSTKQSEQEDSASKQEASQLSHVPTREVVVKATLRQLEKIKHSEQDATQQSATRLPAESSTSVFSTYHQRSLSTSFIPEHPRLNYVSMSVDDTFDEVTYIDEVALKYLSDEELKQFKSEIRPSSSAAAVKRSFTRTVRFGSLPTDNERRSLSRRSLREVDFTWNNLSFCTKNYLTKYNLVEEQVSFAGEDAGQGTQSKDKEKISHETSLDIEPCKPPYPSPARRHSEDSSHILDIKKLKNLPKLF